MSSASTATTTDDSATRILLLDLGGELYAVESAAVREIVPHAPVTRLPGSPAHIRGVMNLRGQLVTLLDLVQRVVGKPARNREGSTIVVQSGERLLGLVVDDVHDVQSVTLDRQGAGPSGPLGAGLVCGLGRLDDAVVLVIDVDEIVRDTLA